MLRMGLIGLGRMGKYHYNLYSEINDISKVALCDIDNRALETIVINGNKETIIRNDYMIYLNMWMLLRLQPLQSVITTLQKNA